MKEREGGGRRARTGSSLQPLQPPLAAQAVRTKRTGKGLDDGGKFSAAALLPLSCDGFRVTGQKYWGCSNGFIFQYQSGSNVVKKSAATSSKKRPFGWCSAKNKQESLPPPWTNEEKLSLQHGRKFTTEIRFKKFATTNSCHPNCDAEACSSPGAARI